jgi:hypothetical protein
MLIRMETLYPGPDEIKELAWLRIQGPQTSGIHH